MAKTIADFDPSGDSSFLEKTIEHLFISELLQHTYFGRGWKVEIAQPEVDDSGYDLIADANGVCRHIQLKASRHGGRRAAQNVNSKLAEKPSGCVLWIIYHLDDPPQRLRFRQFRFFGGKPGKALPSLEAFRTAKHTRGDHAGTKKLRPRIKVVNKGSFRDLSNFDAVVESLFGTRNQE